MFKPVFVSRQRLRLALLALLTSGLHCQALSLLSGPTFIPAANAPLAGTLQLTTDVPSRVSVAVTDGQSSWTHDFYDYGTTHNLTLLGFKASRTNSISVTVYDQAQSAYSVPQPVLFLSPALPADLPLGVVFKSDPARMEPGYTLFRDVDRTSNNAHLVIINSAGEVVWYSGIPTITDVRQLANGDLFIPLVTNIVEINMLGDTVRNWPVPDGLSLDVHDGVPTDHGTILYLNDASEVLTDFPTSDTNPNAPLQTASVLYNPVVEISATNASLLNLWSPINFLDPRRVTYLTFSIDTPQGWDIEHANAVIEDPRDQNIIVSLREQNLVFKFTRDTGQLMWLMGDPANWGPAFQPYLLKPVGQPFAWHYGQHAITITPQGTLMLYDDGNYRASPYDPPLADTNNYSRAVEYSIDEQNMTVSQVWDCGRTNEDVRLYTDKVGNAEWQPQTGNVLIDFGWVLYVNGVRPSANSPGASLFRIREVTHDPVPQVVFDEAFFDYSNNSPLYMGTWSYRAHRIPDLYPVQSNSCPTLAINSAQFILPAAAVGADYSQVLSASEGQPPYTFAFADTNSPVGLGLTPDGTLAGKPLQAGTDQFAVTVTDANGCTGTQVFILNVLGPPPPAALPRATFHGLFYVTNNVESDSSGAFALSTTPAGFFTGSLDLGGQHYPLGGRFDSNGLAQVTIAPHSPAPLRVVLQMDLLDGSDHLTGTVSDGGVWTAALSGDPDLLSVRRQAVPENGRYTLLLPGNPDNPAQPFGDGFATLLVTGSGKLAVQAELADGTRFSQTASLSANGQWPLYAPLYQGHGLLLGWLTFTNDTASALDLEGSLYWVKPNGSGRVYNSGFDAQPMVIGSRWAPPSGGSSLLSYTNGAVVLNGGNLAQALTNTFRLAPKKLRAGSAAEGLELAFSRGSGRFTGSVLAPGSHQRLHFGGVVLQGPNTASGFFLGTNQSGQVLLEPGGP